MPDPHFGNTPAYFKEIASGDTPSSGQVALYAKPDGKMYYKDDLGVETEVGGGGGGGYEPLQAVKTDTESGAPTSWTDISGLSVTYAAASITQKVTVRAMLMAGNPGTADARFRLVNEDGTLLQADAAGNRIQAHAYAFAPNAGTMAAVSFEATVTPGTKSSRTYKVQWLRGGSGNIFINRSSTDSDTTGFTRCASTLTVQPH